MAFSIFKPTPLCIYEDFKRLGNPDYPDTEATESIAERDEPPRCPLAAVGLGAVVRYPHCRWI